MNTCLDCLPCFIRQTLDACRISSSDPAVHEAMIRDVLRWTSEMDLSLSPPAFAQRIHRRLRELTGVNDPYAEEKKLHDEMAKRALPALQRDVNQSDNPLLTAANFAIAGNIIDMGAKTGLTENDLVEAIEHAAENKLIGDTAEFYNAVQRAEKILYLCDNAGEIVFDTMLIEQLGPQRVTAAVRGKPIINDALMDDAVAAVAVGTPVAGCPPRRSVRAALPHTAPPLSFGVKAYARVWMRYCGAGYPPPLQPVEPFPRPARFGFLRATTYRMNPQSSQLRVKFF